MKAATLPAWVDGETPGTLTLVLSDILCAPLVLGPRISVGGEGHGGQKRVLGLARVEPRVLYDDRHIRLDHARVVGLARDGLGVVKVVETDVNGAPCGHGDAVGPDRLAV